MAVDVSWRDASVIAHYVHLTDAFVVLLMYLLLLLLLSDRITRTTYIGAVCCYWPSNVVCHTSEPCKNGWTDRDAVWVEDSGGPKEPHIRFWSRCAHGKGQFWGARGWTIVKYMDTLRSPVWKLLSQSWCCLNYGLGYGPRNHELDRCPDPPMRRGNFGGKSCPL